MEFEPTSTTIGEALAREEDFCIPKYQRSYAWTQSELDDFYHDFDVLFRGICQRDAVREPLCDQTKALEIGPVTAKSRKSGHLKMSVADPAIKALR